MNFTSSNSLKTLASGICWLYTACVIAFFILRAGLPELPPFLALINSLAPLLFLPLPGVCLLAVWLRSKSALLAGAIVFALFVGLYGVLFLPRSGPSHCEGHGTLRVMTFNVGMHLSQPETLVSIIQEQQADLVAVQEMTSHMIQLFERELGPIYPYSVTAPGTETTGLFSRYPILEQRWIEPASGGRAYVQAVVAWKDAAVKVFVVHPLPPGLKWYGETAIPVGLDDTGPQRQIDEVRQRAASEDVPVLILGDFNMSDHTRAYTRVTESFLDAYREAGWGFGFTFPRGLRVAGLPLPGPLTRIDYIFHSHDLCTDWARVGCGGGSDHCYVLAQLGRAD